MIDDPICKNKVALESWHEGHARKRVAKLLEEQFDLKQERDRLAAALRTIAGADAPNCDRMWFVTGLAEVARVALREER